MTSDDDKPISPHAQTVDATAAQDPLVGKRLGSYRIVGRLGAGGMGVVYRAEDEKLRRLVAVKVLADTSGNEERRQRFLREARSAAAITHPNVAVVYQVDEAEGRIYIAMELVKGENLRARLDRGRLDLTTAKDLGLQIARGLAAAHEEGIVHRDLKPENVMITPAGVVKLLDFGLAKAGVARPESGKTEAGLAKTETLVTSDEGRVMGTPEYMSPEQATGEPLDVRSDVFSFGVVLYEMLSGVRPFEGKSTAGVLAAILRDEALPLREKAREVDEGTEAVVMRCLAKAPGDRFSSAGEIVTALEGQTFVKTTAESRTDVQPVARSGSVRRPRTARFAALGLAALAVAGVGVWRLGSRHAVTAARQVESASATSSAPAGGDERVSRSSNPEAQRLFEEAMHPFHDGTGQAIPLLQAAVAADPSFGSAYLRLWCLVQQPEAQAAERAAEYHRQVVALESTLSPRDLGFLGWLEEQTPEGMIAKLDAYLARHPDDDIAWVERATENRSLLAQDLSWLDRSAADRLLGATARALTARPTLAPLFVVKSRLLGAESRDTEAEATLVQCLELQPHAVDCLSRRAESLDDAGECAAAERALRQWGELQPGARKVRSMLAGVLAAEGAPVAAVREALGDDARSYPTDGQVTLEAAVPMFEGDMAQVEKLARDAISGVPSGGSERNHLVPTETLVSAETEAGDLVGAGRVAAEFLARRAAWRDPVFESTGFVIGAAARGGLLDRTEADRRLEDTFQLLVQQRWAPENAWAAVYAYSTETRVEAQAAVARFDALHAPMPRTWMGAWSRAFFLAGRPDDARAGLEYMTRVCSVVFLHTRNWARSHLYLGELDEQAGNKTSACAHYAKVLERWGHAKPKSVTADEARAHATKLGCGL